MKLYKIQKPFIFTIFGASGDLSKVKIFPALYALAEQKRFPQDFFIIGYGRTSMTDEIFRKNIKNAINQKSEISVNKKILDELISHVYYVTGEYVQKKDFQNLGRKITKLSNKKRWSSLHYLAVPPIAFSSIITELNGLKNLIGDDIRLIIEKPFGHDEASARELFHLVSTYFSIKKVFLLDHYLGKEAVQSILALRYANGILNTLLNGNLIANIQISALEDLSVENRISYFDQVGIIKDMIQSHLLQLLALLTMELPVEQEASSIHREKLAVLSALKYRGYEKAMVLGQHISYQQLQGIRKHSHTPTFAALRLFIDRQDWYNVPIYIRTGKMLHKKHTYVVIDFKKHHFQINNKDIESNKLILELQPNERLHLKLFTKVGGIKNQYHDLTTSESLACFGDDCLPEHGRLLLNVFQNDQSNFLSFEEIIATWKFTDKLLSCIEKRKMPVYKYEDYSEGPEEQKKITLHDHYEWYEVPL